MTTITEIEPATAALKGRTRDEIEQTGEDLANIIDKLETFKRDVTMACEVLKGDLMASYKGRIASLEEAIGEAPALRMAAE